MQNMFGPMALKHLRRRERETKQKTGKEKQLEQWQQLKNVTENKSNGQETKQTNKKQPNMNRTPY